MNKPADQNLQNFGLFINALENGRVSDELSRKLEDVVAALNNDYQEHRGAPTAELSLKLTFKLKDGKIFISRAINDKMPKEKSGESIFWVSPGNKLLQQDPRQRTIFETIERKTEQEASA